MAENAREFFTAQQQEDIVCAIRNAEMMTSGEIRLHMENRCGGDVLDRAATIFADLGMQDTAARNGVLIYLAVQDHQLAILGDVGIHQCVDHCFWQDAVDLMLTYFQHDNFCDGLIEGIELIGLKLRENHPYQSDDVNELADDISFGQDHLAEQTDDADADADISSPSSGENTPSETDSSTDKA